MPSEKILIIDDEQIIVDLCLDVLGKEGYQVQSASSGEIALRLADTELFHLLIVDMLMPGMDGLETFDAFKKMHNDILGVLSTAHGTMETALQAMEIGISGFLNKPFTPAKLVRVVKDSLHKAALLKENTRLQTLIPLYKLGEKFILSQSREEVLNELIKAVKAQTGAQKISVMIYVKKENRLHIAASIGINKDLINKVRITPGENISGWVFQNGEPVILNGGPKDNPKFTHILKCKDITAAISFPLKARDRTLGVLNISRIKSGSNFTHSDIEMLSIICSQAVMALENLRIMEERSEKIRMRALFEQYVAPEVAEVLISHGQNPLDVGEIKDITILFADIRNFTPLVQRLPLETLRIFLNDFFDLVTQVIFRFKGTLDKFMGDAVLAIFGSPVPLSEPHNAAISTAAKMLENFAGLKEFWSAKTDYFEDIGLGIGISSGEVFLGNVGSKQRLDYTVLGTDVNLSQRLASEAASNEILISESVKEHMGSQFHITKESMYDIKGLTNPIKVFSINSV